MFSLYLILFLISIKLMCDKVFSQDPFLIVYYPDRYKTQRMCDEVVNDSLATLKLISDWFVISKMIKKSFYCFVCK